MRLTRRMMVGALLAGGAQAALAGAPTRSLRPRIRPDGLTALAVAEPDALVARAGLGGLVSYAVADAATGALLETRMADLPQPPASTAKALTALYALGVLGPQYRFTTRLVATGPIEDGRLDGDLVLVGGGDPVLDTRDLAAMAGRLKESGLREITGAFRVWGAALPQAWQIDVEQPPHVAYNPALGGLNLNFNRVYFEWSRGAGPDADYVTTLDARAGRYKPAVSLAQMEVVDRSMPVYTYADADGHDEWTVARGALGEGGARWLPVRRPALYAGEVFRTLARSHGIVLGDGVETASGPGGIELVRHESAPLEEILGSMLVYSTNLIAEIAGLTATSMRGPVPRALLQSAEAMNDWLKADLGLQDVAMEDHSGLGDDSRVSAADMVRAMVASGPGGALRPLLKDFPLYERPQLHVEAKTGTLNFVSALTGYIDAPNGDLAFAILCSDIERRDALPMSERERPEGGRAWAGRARSLQRDLIERWSTVYG